MGKVTVINTITLDGIMQAPARPDEDTRGGFTHGGWAAPYQDAVIGTKMGELMASGTGSLLFGRRTYLDLHRVWGTASDNPFTAHFKKTRKYVASRTLEEPLVWENSVLLSGDATDEVAELKRQEGNDLAILGSGRLVHSLIRHDLIDEFVLLIAPVVLGTGLRLFPDGHTVRLRFLESLTSTTGVVFAHYSTA